MTFHTSFDCTQIQYSGGGAIGFYLTEENIAKLRDIEKAVNHESEEIIVEMKKDEGKKNIYYATEFRRTFYDDVVEYRSCYFCSINSNDPTTSWVMEVETDNDNKKFVYFAPYVY